MREISYQELINRDELQRLQDEFCSATGVLVYCLDENGKELTRVSGGDAAAEIVQQYAAAGYIRDVCERVEEGSLEDLAICESEVTGGRVAAMAIRADGGTVLYWIVIQAGAEDKARFENILDLLRDASYTLIENKLSCFSAEMESKRSITAQEEMTRDFHVIEATTEIVQLLDSEEPIERLMAQVLRILGKHLDADTAQIFQLREGDQVMDVLSEWLSAGFASYFEKSNGIETVSFLKTAKPQVLTIDGPAGEYHGELMRLGLQAVMVFPILRQDNSSSMVLTLNCRSNRPSWGMQEVKFVSDVVKVLQSILTRRIQKNSISTSHTALEAILDNVGAAIYVTDQETGERLFANDKLQRQFVMELQDGSFPHMLQKAMEGSSIGGSCEFYHEDVERWYDMLYKEIAWVDGTHANLYSLRDITDKKEYQKKIELQAQTDYLTGLYNRMCFEKDLAKYIEDAQKQEGTGALLYLDLDDFKRINDGLGHQYGDELLKSISGSLKQIEGIQKSCYRMGGDEFVIIVPAKHFQRFAKIKDEIRRIFNRSWYLKDAEYRCTMSMGVVTFPDSGDDVNDLLKKADLAMYDAKKSGKNRIATYENGAETGSGRRLDIEQNMRAAIADSFKEFEVFYQPIVELTNVSTEAVGAEALLRWNSEKLGEVETTEFLPLAEYLGLINPIGNYVLHQACTACRQWNENGYPDFKVNVNLSVVQLLQTDIVEIIDETIQATGVNPANLILDVTESLAVSDPDRMKEILNHIRALGVEIALDDFGTGYSSLSHVRELPFNVIKVGQEFTKDLTEDMYVQSFVRMLAELSGAADVRICVEGIENAKQYEVLKDLKAGYAQGFYFGKPISKQEFEEKYIESVDFI